MLPIPGDIILGDYHPWSSVSWGRYASPYPVKVFEMNDSVNFYYPIKLEIVRQLSRLHIPIWNSYILNGTPLLGDGHSGAVYPLNLLLLIGNFNFGWSLFIIIQPLLGSWFLYLYLRHKNLSRIASLFGSISFAFSSYFINQTELANVMHVALWFPLMLLGIDLIHEENRRGILVLLIASVMMFLAGFMQFFFYGSLLGLIYFFAIGKINKNKAGMAFLVVFMFILVVGVQLLPFLNFLPQTVRWRGAGVEVSVTEWLLKPKLLITLIAPDFFGHPATQNWTGGYAYYEFIAYVGPYLLPLLFLSLKSRHKIRNFFIGTLVFSLLTVVRNPLSLYIYRTIPLLSSFTPSRMLLIFILSASILLALGMEEIVSLKRRQTLKVFFGYILFLVILLVVSRNKQILPSLALTIILVPVLFQNNKKYVLLAITFFTCVSLFYQGHKYLSFTSSDLVFPETKTTRFLEDNLNGYRFLSIHPETLPSNSNMVYKLPTSNGYHPVHDYDYHVLTSKLQYQNNELSFGKTIFLTRINQPVLDLSHAKYIVNLGEITNPEVLPLVKKVFTEGDTITYEVSSPSGIEAVYPELYYEQIKWTRIGLVITSIGLVAALILFRKK